MPTGAGNVASSAAGFNFNSTADEHFQADRVSASLELLPEGGCYVNVSYLRGETVLSGEGF